MQATKPDSEGKRRYHPCGRCPACKKNNATSWAIRCYHESLSHNFNSFLTLTYDDDFLLPSKHRAYPGSLSKEHFQDFIKNFRYYYGKDVRYFCGGEYGDKGNRPHYHVILFGVNVADSIFYDRLWVASKKGWSCRVKGWNKGYVFLLPLELGGCFYCTKYCLKYDDKLLDELKFVNQQTPFRLMSTRPGLGTDWFLKHKEEILYNGYIRFKGSKLAIPRFYYDKALPVGSLDREDYSNFRHGMFSKFSKEDRDKYNGLVGKGKLTWSELYARLGDQQALNLKEKR
ncbi:replication initiator protein [Dipodfec virus UA06Rod_21]|uniref:Replication initiator protein n=1 Tax=Dipodfec virus UA06Rod_21 TaxID=2929321 RepID=A0A976N1B0_9VIRU|nr:replication initiator protein [Dipodfec virus UA06Rod_21]